MIPFLNDIQYNSQLDRFVVACYQFYINDEGRNHIDLDSISESKYEQFSTNNVNIGIAGNGEWVTYDNKKTIELAQYIDINREEALEKLNNFIRGVIIFGDWMYREVETKYGAIYYIFQCNCGNQADYISNGIDKIFRAKDFSLLRNNKYVIDAIISLYNALQMETLGMVEVATMQSSQGQVSEKEYKDKIEDFEKMFPPETTEEVFLQTDLNTVITDNVKYDKYNNFKDFNATVARILESIIALSGDLNIEGNVTNSSIYKITVETSRKE